MTPFVGNHERPLEREHVGCDERLEEERIGHPAHRGAPEVPVEQRAFWSADHGYRAAADQLDGAGERGCQLRFHSIASVR